MVTRPKLSPTTVLLLHLLQRSTAVQVRSSARLMPQNQPSSRGLLSSPTAWSPDQHHAAMLADISRHILGRTEGRGLGFGLVSLSTLTKGSVWNANPLQMGTQTTMPCAQAEDSGLLGPLQSPNWVKVCLISTVVFLPVSIVPTTVKPRDGAGSAKGGSTVSPKTLWCMTVVMWNGTIVVGFVHNIPWLLYVCLLQGQIFLQGWSKVQYVRPYISLLILMNFFSLLRRKGDTGNRMYVREQREGGGKRETSTEGKREWRWERGWAVLASVNASGPVWAWQHTRPLGDKGNIEGSRPEWCISSMIYSRDTPFWSGTLDGDNVNIFLAIATSSAFDVMTVLNPQAGGC